MSRKFNIPTVYGTATGAEALKRVNFLLEEVEKQYSIWMNKIIPPGETILVKYNTMMSLQKDKEYLEAEKKAIIEKVAMIEANLTPYGVMGKEYWDKKNSTNENQK